MASVTVIKDECGKIIIQISHNESTTTLVFPDNKVNFEEENDESFEITFEDDKEILFPFKIKVFTDTIIGTVEFYAYKLYLKMHKIYDDVEEAKQTVKVYRDMEFDYPISYDTFKSLQTSLKNSSTLIDSFASDFDTNENEILATRYIYSFENTQPGILHNGLATANSS